MTSLTVTAGCGLVRATALLLQFTLLVTAATDAPTQQDTPLYEDGVLGYKRKSGSPVGILPPFLSRWLTQ